MRKTVDTHVAVKNILNDLWIYFSSIICICSPQNYTIFLGKVDLGVFWRWQSLCGTINISR